MGVTFPRGDAVNLGGEQGVGLSACGDWPRRAAAGTHPHLRDIHAQLCTSFSSLLGVASLGWHQLFLYSLVSSTPELLKPVSCPPIILRRQVHMRTTTTPTPTITTSTSTPTPPPKAVTTRTTTANHTARNTLNTTSVTRPLRHHDRRQTQPLSQR